MISPCIVIVYRGSCSMVWEGLMKCVCMFCYI